MSGGAGFSALGAGLELGSALLGGLNDRSALRAQARIDEENARLALLSGEQQIAQTIRDERMVSGVAIAALAGSGFALGTGSAADIIRQNAIEREVEVLNIRAQAQGEALIFRQAAEDARAAGHNAVIGGVLKAGSVIAGHAIDRGSQSRLDTARDRDLASRLPRKARSTAVGAYNNRLSVLGLPGN